MYKRKRYGGSVYGKLKKAIQSDIAKKIASTVGLAALGAAGSVLGKHYTEKALGKGRKKRQKRQKVYGSGIPILI